MVTAEASTGGGGQEQNPEARNVKPRSSSSAAWEYFTPFTESDGRRKARCNKCNRVFAADAKTNGTSRLLRHAGRCCQLQMASLPRAAPVPLPPQSCAPSHPEEHESNQLVVYGSSHSPSSLLSNNLAMLSLPGDHQPSSPSASFFDDLPVPQPITPAPAQAQLSIDPPPPPPVPQTVPYDPPPQPPLPCPLPPSSSHSDISTSNNLASFRPHDYDMQVQAMQLSQPRYQQSSPTPSYPTDLPPTPACDPLPPASPHNCTDPPLSVPQTDPQPPLPSTSNDPPPPSMSCPPPSQLDEELPDAEHGQEDDEEASNHLARLIALHGYDPALVDDDCFRSFVRSLNPEFKLPSRLAVEDMCDAIFDENETRKDLLSKLSRSPGQVSLAVATAKTFYGEVLYTACHFIDDEWKLHKVVLDAYLAKLSPVFYGALSGSDEVTLNSDGFRWAINHFVYGISKRGILDKLFMIASENVDVEMQQYMSRKFSDDFKRRLFCVTFMDRAFHIIADLILPEDFSRKMLSGMNHLDLTRQERQQFFSRTGLEHQRAYDSMWYSIYCSLKFLRKDTELTEAKFYKVWDELYHGIQRISVPTGPTSNLVLIELFNLKEVLQSELARTTGEGKDDVAKVLSTIEMVVEGAYLWSPPLVVDPRYKLTYIKFAFRRAFTSSKAAQIIANVTRSIKNLYANYVSYGDGNSGLDYDSGEGDTTLREARAEHGQSQCAEREISDDMQQLVIAGMAAQGSSVPAPADSFRQAWDKHRRSRDHRTEASSSYMDSEKELDRYLEDDLAPDTQDFDILGWWKLHMSEYPTVSRMARDVLAMPTCSNLSAEQMAHLRSIIRGYSK